MKCYIIKAEHFRSRKYQTNFFIKDLLQIKRLNLIFAYKFICMNVYLFYILPIIYLSILLHCNFEQLSILLGQLSLLQPILITFSHQLLRKNIREFCMQVFLCNWCCLWHMRKWNRCCVNLNKPNWRTIIALLIRLTIFHKITSAHEHLNTLFSLIERPT